MRHRTIRFGLTIAAMWAAMLLQACAQPTAPDGKASPDTPISDQQPAQQPAQPPAQSPGLVRGVVTNADGRRVSQVQVVPISLDQVTQGVPEISVISDDEGQYQWALAPGRYELRFLRDGYSPVTATVQLAAGQTVVHDIVLKRP